MIASSIWSNIDQIGGSIKRRSRAYRIRPDASGLSRIPLIAQVSCDPTDVAWERESRN
jgi:hypothetical protein